MATINTLIFHTLNQQSQNQYQLSPAAIAVQSIHKQQFFYQKLVAAILFIVVSLSSCVASKLPANQEYFQDLKRDTVLTNLASKQYENKIQVGDKLLIQATSLNAVEDNIFNQGGTEAGEAGGKAFLVKPNGTVLLHRLGDVLVVGLTRNELSLKLQKDLSGYMKDLIVAVAFVNHKITVMGAVATPQVIAMKEEQMPVIDALILSGDVSLLGKTNDVIIIREQGNTKQVKHINLQQSSILQSEWYYLKPNDIVFVPKDDTLLKDEMKKQKRENLRNTVAFVASGLSLLILILDRVIQ